MAQDGDTITYTYDGDLKGGEGRVVKPEQEDISGVNKAIVEYCDGAGGKPGKAGGRVENAEIDLSGQDTLYIFVGAGSVGGSNDGGYGRYDGGSGADNVGGGSTEITFSNTDKTDSADEPFLIGAGGGGSDNTGLPPVTGMSGGARGGQDRGDGIPDADGSGTAPPAGGDSQDVSDSLPTEAGDGAIDDQNRGLVTGGTTIKGGGNSSSGEVQITYKLNVPDAPTNVAITDASTEGELTLDWDSVSEATSYKVYRAESSGASKSDYTQIANPTSPPFTDTGLEDGEQYFYRVSSVN